METLPPSYLRGIEANQIGIEANFRKSISSIFVLLRIRSRLIRLVKLSGASINREFPFIFGRLPIRFDEERSTRTSKDSRIFVLPPRPSLRKKVSRRDSALPGRALLALPGKACMHPDADDRRPEAF